MKDSGLKNLTHLDMSELRLSDSRVEYDGIVPGFRTLRKRKTVVTRLSTAEKLRLYRMNAKKSTDPKGLFEYAKFCIENKDGSTVEGFQILKKLGNKGIAEAQYYIGDAFAGDGRLEAAYMQYWIAAKKSYPPALHAVAKCAEFGTGCKIDIKLSLKIYIKAATVGNRDAIYRLGLAELRGELGLMQDVLNAVKWFKRGTAGNLLFTLVADKNRPEPIFELGRIFEFGMLPSVQADPILAYSLFKDAAKLDYLPAIYHLAQAYGYGAVGCHIDAV